MRIIAFSDSHGNESVLDDIVSLHPQADLYIHLGDGERDVDCLVVKYPDKNIIHIRGNCDFASLSASLLNLSLEGGHRLMAVHGHNQGVKYSLDTLKSLAKENEADIVLFGHTHHAVAFYENGVYYMNPGAALSNCYGIIDITKAGVVTVNSVYNYCFNNNS